uniref:hypothetical protein n=1 Tax=Nonomuraea rhizosphaerae TaxID=2665663 RepID=UPI001C5F35AF
MVLSTETSEDVQGPLFSHATRPERDRSVLRAATRYLSAAAYLDGAFRDHVTDELLVDIHRAVARSQDGLDIEPVLRHCVRARRMAVVRDVLLILAMVAALAVEALSVVVLLALVLPFARPVSRAARKLPRRRRTLAYALQAAGLFVIIGWCVLQLRARVGTFMEFDEDWWQAVSARGVPPGVGALLFVGLAAVVIAGFRVSLVVTLAWRLRAGIAVRLPRVYGWAVRKRIKHVAAAQYGNITLYSEKDDDDRAKGRKTPPMPFAMMPSDPAFLGAGAVARVWAISVELDRKDGEGRVDRPVDISPVALHDFVRHRMESMRDEVIHDSERIRNLTVHDHVVARGLIQRPRRGQAGSLIDEQSLQPYSLASEEAVTALMSHPQGGVRHYQLIVVGSEREAVNDDEGRPIAAPDDQEVVVSAFVHLAVEGRMLYTEFVSTVLPPIRQQFHVVDQLPRGPLALLAPIEVTPRQPFLPLVFGAPARRLSALLGGLDLRGITQTPRFQVMHDYGARKSVRELGAFGGLSVNQRLEAFKYTKLLSQRLLWAVIDFLDKEHVDTTSFRQQAATIVATTTINIGGGQAAGQGGGGGGSLLQPAATPKPQPS